MVDSDSQNHLALPERDSIDDGRLDLLRHQCIIILHQTDLRSHLNGDHTGQLQIMDLLLKPVAERRHIVDRLRILRKAGLMSLVHESRQLASANLIQFLLARQNVHAQFLKVSRV